MDSPVELEDSLARVHPNPTSSTSTRQHSRPTSVLEITPYKEPIKFTVNLIGAPVEVEELVEHIKHVAEQFLYHWKTFPIGKNQFMTFPSHTKISQIISSPPTSNYCQ